jgi:hypothetical protein
MDSHLCDLVDVLLRRPFIGCRENAQELICRRGFRYEFTESQAVSCKQVLINLFKKYAFRDTIPLSALQSKITATDKNG